MAKENKTKMTQASVAEFLSTLVNEEQYADSNTLGEIMGRVSGEPAKLWGSNIIGFGTYHYKYNSGREGDAPIVAFSPRKGYFSLYILDSTNKHLNLLKKLGEYKVGKSCIYVNKLSDIDLQALEKLISVSYKETAKKWGVSAL